ncbi:MAG: hypothetical protein AB1656_17375 [Candidatus Omnitrophota bacterium]
MMNRKARTIGVIAGLLLTVGAPIAAAQGLSPFAPAAAWAAGPGISSITTDETRGDIIFSYQEPRLKIDYCLNPRSAIAVRGLINVRVVLNDQVRIIPVYDGGFIVRNATGETITPGDYAKEDRCKLVSHQREGNHYSFSFQETIDGVTCAKKYDFSMQGKTFVIQAVANCPPHATAYYCGFDIGESRFLANPKVFVAPSSLVPAVEFVNQYYFSVYVDPLLSAAGEYATFNPEATPRSVRSSNTPAMFLANADGTYPPLEMTAYLTVSPLLADVLPASSVKTEDLAGFRDRILLDLGEIPLARYPLTPSAAIRRWEAPSSGYVKLKGTFSLVSGEKASCEVHLLEADGEKNHILFSQILDPAYKPATGIQGDFPLAKGDQLLFAAYGPAVQSGGETKLNVSFEFDGEQYSSIEDYSDAQGDRGWFYEQQDGPMRTLMIWNPKSQCWESPETQSCQTREILMSRMGAKGDAFIAAEKFFDELGTLGLKDFSFLIKGWPDHARFAPLAAKEKDVWGTAEQLKFLTMKETTEGNTVVYAPDSTGVYLALAAKSRLMGTLTAAGTHPATANPSIMQQLSESMLEKITADAGKMSFTALWLDFPHPAEIVRFATSLYTLTGQEERSSRRLFGELRDYFAGFKRTAKKSIVIEDRGDQPFLSPFLPGFGDASFAPFRSQPQYRGIADHSALYQRPAYSLIGMGPYPTFFQTSDRPLDPRFTPFDQYISAEAAFGRLPYLSLDFWFPGMAASDIRKYIMEYYSLAKPITREYLDPKNAVKEIYYENANGVRYSLDAALKTDKWKDAARCVIQYANGLVIRTNRSVTPWKMTEPGLQDFAIDRDGFLARNAKTRLIALIGRQTDHPFSVGRAGTDYFLHSRDGSLVSFPPFATDGMVRIWFDSEGRGRCLACLKASEVTTNDLTQPLFRSNKRIDGGVRWLSANQLEIRILEADKEGQMIEYFDLPARWLQADAPLSVVRTNIFTERKEANRYWSIAKAGENRGLRIPNAQTGDIFTITYGSASGS